MLAFANITGDAADEWIGQGIAESLTADFAKIGGVTVIPRENVFELQRNLIATGRGADDRHSLELGRRLGATFVVTGAYQRLRDRVRITSQVFEVPASRSAATVKLDGTIDQIFDLQDRLVQDLARTGMAHELASSERDAIVATHESRSRRSRPTRAACSTCGWQAATRGPRPGTLRARARAVARLRGRDVALGSALDLKGTFLADAGLLERSLSLLQQAVALKPDSAEAHLRLGETLSDLGRIDEGIAEMQEALRLAPDDAETHASLARNYWMGKGDADLGVVHYRRALALNPEGGYTHLQLALLHALRGELDDAEREARAAVVLQEQAMSGTQGLSWSEPLAARLRVLSPRPLWRGYPRVPP